MSGTLQRAHAALEQGDATLACACALVSIADSLERLTPAVQSGALAAVAEQGSLSGQTLLRMIDRMGAGQPASGSAESSAPSTGASPASGAASSSGSSSQSMSSQSMSSTTTGASVLSPVSWGTAPNSRGGA